jgi:L-fuconolactonase
MSERWRDEIAELAALGVHCKLSGLRTEQARGQNADGLAPYVGHLVASFGDRLMWGSDWPVLLLSGDGWRRWYEDATRLAANAGADFARLFHGAAADFYTLGDQQ